MKKRNGSDLQLDCAKDETITVTIAETATNLAVTFELNKPPGAVFPAAKSLTFTVQRGDVGPGMPFDALLTLFVTFTGTSGGRYDVTITGSGGGDTSRFFVVQGALGADLLNYEFFVV